MVKPKFELAMFYIYRSNDATLCIGLCLKHVHSDLTKNVYSLRAF